MFVNSSQKTFKGHGYFESTWVIFKKGNNMFISKYPKNILWIKLELLLKKSNVYF